MYNASKSILEKYPEMYIHGTRVKLNRLIGGITVFLFCGIFLTPCGILFSLLSFIGTCLTLGMYYYNKCYYDKYVRPNWDRIWHEIQKELSDNDNI